MSKRKFPIIELTLDTIVGGGQTLGTMPDGRKIFVWGGLPGELVHVQVTKKKSHWCEGVVTDVQTASNQRIEPRDPDSYLSTSPWQIMTFDAEQHYKAALIEEAFELHSIVLPGTIDVYSDDVEYGYRNKIEFSWYGDTDGSTGVDTLDLAFFRRGSKGKIVVDGTSLARPEINQAAGRIRDVLHRRHSSARSLKTLLIRVDRAGGVAAQLYVKDEDFPHLSDSELEAMDVQGFELIYSNPKSPASVITRRLQSHGQTYLHDTILDVPFTYAVEGFFQINLPVYEQALRDMDEWVSRSSTDIASSLPPQVPPQGHSIGGSASPWRSARPDGDIPSDELPGEARRNHALISETAPARVTGGGAAPKNTFAEQKIFRGKPAGRTRDSDLRVDSDGIGDDGSGESRTIDLYSGVGTIGLTIGGDNVTLVESNEHAVREMERNIKALGRESSARAVLAPSETALDHITGDAVVIVDPPRAGLHQDVIAQLLATKPPRIVYLSCNPATQARDVARLCADGTYGIRHHRGYNFFPRTPHIEHLIILDLKY